MMINDLNEAQIALDEIQAKYSDFFDFVADWVWVSDPEMRLTFVSNGVMRCNGGLDPATYHGKTLQEINIEAGANPEKWKRFFAAQHARVRFRNLELAIVDPDGGLRRWLVSGQPVFDSTGECLGYRGVGRDITEPGTVEEWSDISDSQQHLATKGPRLGEESTPATAALLAAIMDHAPAEIYLKDVTGRYLQINRYYEMLWGLKNGEVRGRLPADVHSDEEFAAASRAHDLEVLEGNLVVEREQDITLDGVQHTMHITKFPVRDAAGDVVALGAIALDITDRKKVETDLREAEDRFRHVAQLSSDWFWEMDADLRFSWFSEGYEEKMGSSARSMIGKTRWELAAGPHEDEAWEEHRADLEARRAFRNFQYEIMTDSGDSNYRSVSGVPLFDSQGTFYGYRGTATDITARRRAENALKKAHDELERRVEERTRELGASEKRFRDYAEAAADWFWEMDADLRFTYMSNSVKRILGVPPEWHYGKTREDLLSEDCDREVWSEHLETLRAHRPFRNFEYLRTGEGVEAKWLRTSGIPIFSDDGEFCGYRGTASDISEQRRVEAILEESEAKLRQAQKMEAVGQLTGGIAHDFNNLLTVILGNIQLVRDSLRDDRENEALLCLALRATMRGADLTQRLLAYSRQQALQPKALDVNHLVQDTCEQLLQRTLGEDVGIEFHFASVLPPVLVDPGQLESALLNLALNARDAMPEGGTLTLETKETQLDKGYIEKNPGVEPGTYVQLAVSDNGTGMPAEIIERAVEPFFTTKDVGAGSGLGLSMVYGFLKQSGGHINIYSEVGEGTTVKLYLPVTQKASEQIHVTERFEEIPASNGDETVLVVEDDTDVRRFVYTVLTKLGYTVAIAKDGPSVLALLRDGLDHLHLLITDVILPGGMRGPHLAAEIGQMYPQVKVLFMSGYTENVIVHNGRLDEGVELLSKPFDQGALARKVREVLDDRAPDGR